MEEQKEYSLRKLLADHFSRMGMEAEELAALSQRFGQIKQKYPEVLNTPLCRIPESFPSPSEESASLLDLLVPPLTAYVQMGVPIELAQELGVLSRETEESLREALQLRGGEVSEEMVETAKVEMAQLKLLTLSLLLVYQLGRIDGEDNK